MLHSVAGQIEYANSMSDSISDLIQYALRLQERLDDDSLIRVGMNREEEENVLKRIVSLFLKLLHCL